MEIEKNIILHRGDHEKDLENGCRALENCLKKNFSFETDVRLSRDKTPFVIHDSELYRLFGIPYAVNGMYDHELKNCTFKKNKKLNLLSLDELARLMVKYNNSSLAFIHIKEY